MKKAISWEEFGLIEKISERAFALMALNDRVIEPVPLCVDIATTHVHSVALDLRKLLDFDDADFLHDVVGITDHFDRTTCKLDRSFWPRCAVQRV